MITSMTAYARTEKTRDQLTVTVELRTYNGKYLDIVLRTPHGFDSLENRIKAQISRSLSRGRVEAHIRITDESEAAFLFEVDRPKARAYFQALTELKQLLGIQADIRLEQVAGTLGLIRPVETDKDLDRHWPVMEACLAEALAQLTEMRRTEGAYLEKDFQQRLTTIETFVREIEDLSVNLPAHYKQRLEERMASLTKGVVTIDPDRIAQEAAFLADRSDISEEIVRAKSHVIQFREMMAGTQPPGRKLNFLIQEMNREFNTIGSKSSKTEISHIVVQAKSELEKIREQVQNVE